MMQEQVCDVLASECGMCGQARCQNCSEIITNPIISLVMRTLKGDVTYCEFCSDVCFTKWIEDVLKIHHQLND
ncbi:hypothetical protein HOE04_05220 [archaeon]|jgi:hypothetical protein|nr:hypothetical protein [archaeon]